MAEAGVMREFLVSLGWTVDQTGQKRFQNSLKGADQAATSLGDTLKILAEVLIDIHEQLTSASGAAHLYRDALSKVGTAVEQTSKKSSFLTKAGEAANQMMVIGQRIALSAGAAFLAESAAVFKTASAYSRLGYESQIAMSSVSGMQSFSYAVGQMGGSAEAARGSLQAMGNFLRSNPGGESFIARLGVQTRDTHGELRDTADVMQDLAKQFQAEPYYQAKAQAGVLGIDENTLQAMRRGLGQFGSEYRDIYRRAGVDQNQAARSSATFMQQLRSLGLVFQALRDKVAISLERGVGGDIVRFRKLMLENFDRITDIIVRATRFILALGDALAQLFGRGVGILSDLWDHFNNLDQSTRTWIVTIGALGAAWRLLNRGFLATPLGRLLAIGGAIIALYDDYKTWKAGGTSLIDWAQWKPGIDAAMDALHQIGVLFDDMWPRAQRWLAPFNRFMRTELATTFKQIVALVNGTAKAFDDLLHGNFRKVGSDVRDAYREFHKQALIDQDATGNMLGDYGGMVGIPQRAESGLAYLLGQGFDRTHALAVLGNLQQESGLNTSARNGSHAGLAQWDEPRQKAILAGTGIDVTKAGYIDQLKALVWEMRQGGEKGAGKRFMETSGLEAATGFFAQNIERSGENPGDLGFDRRIAYARAMDSRYVVTGGSDGKPISVTANIPQGQNAAPPANQSTGQPVTVTQTNHITVNGSHNPEQTGQSILRVQNQASANLVRNAKTRLM